MSFLKTLCIVSVLFLLTGCGFSMKPLQTPPVPANAARECAKLEQVAEGADLGVLLQSAVDMAQTYNDCRARHKALIDYLS